MCEVTLQIDPFFALLQLSRKQLSSTPQMNMVHDNA